MPKIPTSICIHHTAVSYTKNADQWKATDAYHASKGWGGGGYHYEVAANGSIHQFRADGTVSAAQYQNNLNNGQCLSICLDMNGDIEEPTPQQKETVAKWLLEKMNKYNIPPQNVFCHRKVAHYKSCPGKKMPDNILYYFLPMIMNVPPSEWAKEDWQFLIDNKIIQSDTNPLAPADKEWVAVVSLRLFKLFNDKTINVQVPISQTTQSK